MPLIIENKGLLWFHDSGKKFLGERHALCNLTRENDIWVYSLTPKGEKQPKYLIVKVMQAGAMQIQSDGTATGDAQCVVMEIMEYDKVHPMNLFSLTKEVRGILQSNVRNQVSQTLLRQNGFLRDRLTPQEFFSIEVDPASDDQGAKIYLRDKAHFLGISE